MHHTHVCQLQTHPEDGENMQDLAIDIFNALVSVHNQMPVTQSKRKRYNQIDATAVLEPQERGKILSFCYRHFEDGQPFFEAKLVIEKLLDAIGLCPSMESYIDGGLTAVLKLILWDMTTDTIEAHRLQYIPSFGFTFSRGGRVRHVRHS